MNDKELRSSIRRAAGVSGTTIPIVVIDGDTSPNYKGSPGHYRNKRGDVIQHPNAYRRAWGKPIYFSSTQMVEVGSEWTMHVGLTASPLKTS